MVYPVTLYRETIKRIAPTINKTGSCAPITAFVEPTVKFCALIVLVVIGIATATNTIIPTTTPIIAPIEKPLVDSSIFILEIHAPHVSYGEYYYINITG